MSRTTWAVGAAGLLCGFVLGVWCGIGVMVQGMPQSGDAAITRPWPAGVDTPRMSPGHEPIGD